jgi:hypothetical protein
MLFCAEREKERKIDDDNLKRKEKKRQAVNMISPFPSLFIRSSLSHQKSLSAIQCKDDDAVKYISEGVLSVLHNRDALKKLLLE